MDVFRSIPLEALGNGWTAVLMITLCGMIVYICTYSFSNRWAAVLTISVSGSMVHVYLTALGYGSAAVLIISVSGLIVVSTIPCLQRVFLNTVLQFLVSLAVGALTGDAMLHLIPHALAGEDGEEKENRNKVFKGMCGLAGIYIFFLFGKLQGIYMNKSLKRKEENRKLATHFGDMSIKVRKPEEEGSEVLQLKQEKNDEKYYGDGDIKKANAEKSTEEENHGHSHDHDLPKSVGGMVWRVIIGDGIHNFSDGIAIGVAFANSITGGLSTSVAVLCHELPHEMGDFAVLLKKGMSIKQAILYNCLSSFLSFIGMVVGLFLGNIGDSSGWIFVGIAGMFLYISLVDLMPEMAILDSENRERQPFRQLFFQLGGIVIGIIIMLLIAIFEERLRAMFN